MSAKFTVAGPMADGVPYHHIDVQRVGATGFSTSAMFPPAVPRASDQPFTPVQSMTAYGAPLLYRDEMSPHPASFAVFNLQRLTTLVAFSEERVNSSVMRKAHSTRIYTTSEELMNLAKVLVSTAGHLATAPHDYYATVVDKVPRYAHFGRGYREEKTFSVVGRTNNLITSWSRLGFWLPTQNEEESRELVLFDISKQTLRVMLDGSDLDAPKAYEMRLDYDWHLRYAEMFIHLAALAAEREARFDEMAAATP